MSYIYPIKTEDGTISLFNTEVNDVYHSKIGAYTEALNKFIIPSGILEYVKNNNEVKILDMCAGLGYNSKVAINEVWKINPDCHIKVTGLENDPEILGLSVIIAQNSFSDELNTAYAGAISRLIDLNSLYQKYTNDVSFLEPDFADLFSQDIFITPGGNKSGLLHNIYYQTLSNRNTYIQNSCYNKENLVIDLYLCDARDIIISLEPNYNYIFHDPFTPSKLPTLWSVELLKQYYRLLDNYGNITTYSSAAPVRSGLIEAGFYIGSTQPIGRKASGTIAYKNKDNIMFELSDKERGLLETKAGIPYYDKELNLSSDDILRLRKQLQDHSSRISTSKYLKQYNVR